MKQTSKQQRGSQEPTSRTSKSANDKASGDGVSKTGTQKQTAGENTKGPSLLEKFFLDQLRDIYYAEQKIAKSLEQMKSAATTEELKEAFEDHQHQTERHVKRLEKVFGIVKQNPEGKKCEAIEGIVREAEEIMSETKEGTMTRDAALILAAQKVEHYEIATYGGLVQLAITMGLSDAADILDKTLMEEEDTDQLLTDIAESNINLDADQEGSKYSWQEEEETEEAMA